MERSTESSVSNLTEKFNRLVGQDFPLANALASIAQVNDTQETRIYRKGQFGTAKSEDQLYTGSTLSQNIRAFVNEKYEDNSSDDSFDETMANVQSRRPSSLAASVNLFYNDQSRKQTCLDDDKDYDEAWPRSPLLNCTRPSVGPIYHLMTSKVATLRDGLHSERRMKRRSSDATPLISSDYVEPRYMDPSSIASRPRSTFYTETYLDYMKLGEDKGNIENISGRCQISSRMGTKSKSQLPRNALLQYFGKTELRPEEVANMYLTRAIQELTHPTHVGGKNLGGARKTTFVLIRILEDELIIEGRASSSQENLKGNQKQSGKLRKRFSFEKKRNAKSSKGIFRKKSSPAISSNVLEKPIGKKSVIDLTEVDVAVGVYGKIDGDFAGGDVKRSGKRSGMCMDIFLCMGCKNGSLNYDSALDDEEVLSSAMKSTTLSAPVNGNKIISSFELERIVYCGAEHTEHSGIFLLTWLYHVTDSSHHSIECHAAACDDLQHAKSLATSLGDAIRKAIRK